MDGALTPDALKRALAAFPPPTPVDVLRAPAFDADPEVKWGMVLYDALYAGLRDAPQ